jgi:hypothetical protein
MPNWTLAERSSDQGHDVSPVATIGAPQTASGVAGHAVMSWSSATRWAAHDVGGWPHSISSAISGSALERSEQDTGFGDVPLSLKAPG